MNRQTSNKIFLLTICLFLILSGALAGYAAQTADDLPPKTKISVIVSDSTNDKWSTLFAGLRDGAREHNMSLSLVSTDAFTSIEEQISYVEQEIKGGTEAIILEPFTSPGAYDLADAISHRVPVLAIGNPPTSDQFPSYHYRNRAMGESIAKRVKKDFRSHQELKIGILCEDEDSEESHRRLRGFQAEMPDTWEVAWTIRSSHQAVGALASNQHIQPADVIVALDSSSIDYAIDYKLEKPEDTIALYGIGNSEKSVYYLDKGIITAMAVPNAFDMGYLSICAIAKKIDTHKDILNHEIDYIVVDQETMYDESFQKILFPLN